MKFYLFLMVLAFVYAKSPVNYWTSIDQVNEAVNKYCGPCCVAEADTEPGEGPYNDCVNCCLNPEKKRSLWPPKLGKAGCKYDRTRWPKCKYVINETRPWNDKSLITNEYNEGKPNETNDIPEQPDVPNDPNGISNRIDRIPLKLTPLQPLGFVLND